MNSIILKYDYELELLEDILNQTCHIPTDLLVCSSKADLLEQLIVQLGRISIESETQTPLPQEEADAQFAEHSCKPRHILLSKTLHALSASQLISLVFCPTIPLLRGYLSGYVSRSTSPSTHSPGRIIILNLLAMHHGTSEFTLQGLSQTLAAAVSAGHRTNRVLKLVECKDVNDPSNPNRGPSLWQTEVQLLSAAIKLGETGRSWGRRTISVMRIASRWFTVEQQNKRHREEHNPVILARNSPEEEILV
ncbi:uncharacterized protein Z519_11839 [Cladophialophora bantiana CBS 173.52]|uniref:Uncharacterized protein n=1 Tax=Cladophialophora bantiana (strain ATCC 10958 / CBS 173.52 / CDC B-1940 / NIH 8579) TaxID=1442370 RepID=A0A0D2EBS5_CLAB1|nr:uncharacterized protein Z519_11839 [Cladophialophora bantiana CBS 173.52]KIW87516.1 hypothetical protein Z519_11839 [Cladophialophora bantiana CBS 173.52]